MYKLSEEQIQFYKDNGFLVVKNLFSIPVLDTYRQRFVDVCNGKLKGRGVLAIKDHALYKRGANPEEYINKVQELINDEVFSTYSEDPHLLDVVGQLIGDNITLTNSMLINKPPGTNEHAPHQDMLFFPVRPIDKVVGTWTAIDPATRDNGCLFVVPGSHRAGFCQHHYPHNECKSDVYRIAEPYRVAPEARRVPLELRPGDTALIHPLVVHGSRANVSLKCRKAMTCHYMSSDCTFIEVAGSEHEPLVKRVEADFRKKGLALNFVDVLKCKSKSVRTAKCKL